MDSPNVISVHTAALHNARYVLSTCSRNHHLLTALILAQHLARLPQIEELDQRFIERGYLNQNLDAVGLLRCVCNFLSDVCPPLMDGQDGGLFNLGLFTPQHRSFYSFHPAAVMSIDASANDVSIISVLNLLSIASDAFAFNEIFSASMRFTPWRLGSFLEDMENGRTRSLVFALYNSWVFSFNIATAPFNHAIRIVESLVSQACNTTFEEES